MVTERSVVRVFLYGHDLYGIIPVGDNAGKNFFAEFVIRTDALVFLRHTYVAFVDEQRRCMGDKFFLFEDIRFLRRPYLCRKDFCGFILHDTGCPCRYTFALPSFPVHRELIEVEVVQLFGIELDFPYAVG